MQQFTFSVIYTHLSCRYIHITVSWFNNLHRNTIIVVNFLIELLQTMSNITKQKYCILPTCVTNNIKLLYIINHLICPQTEQQAIYLVTVQPYIVSNLSSAASGHGNGKQNTLDVASWVLSLQPWGYGDIFGLWRRGAKMLECDLPLPLRI